MFLKLVDELALSSPESADVPANLQDLGISIEQMSIEDIVPIKGKSFINDKNVKSQSSLHAGLQLKSRQP